MPEPNEDSNHTYRYLDKTILKKVTFKTWQIKSDQALCQFRSS